MRIKSNTLTRTLHSTSPTEKEAKVMMVDQRQPSTNQKEVVMWVKPHIVRWLHSARAEGPLSGQRERKEQQNNLLHWQWTYRPDIGEKLITLEGRPEISRVPWRG